MEGPAELQVLMSAIKDDVNGGSTTEPGRRIHTFHQDVPIPSYLIAIVCGALESR